MTAYRICNLEISCTDLPNLVTFIVVGKHTQSDEGKYDQMPIRYKKKLFDIPIPGRDVTYQTVPGRE
jgi:hypothetical protein